MSKKITALQKEIQETKDFIADKSTPADEKAFAEKELTKLEAKLKKLSGGDKPTTKGSRPIANKKSPAADDPDCIELMAQFKKDRAAAKQRSKNPKSISEKVTDHIELATSQAIENIPAAKIKDDPKGWIKKITALEEAAKTFAQATRAILGSEYKAKEVEEMIKHIEQLVQGLKKKYA